MRAASPAALPRALFSFLLLAATLNFCLQRQGTYGQTLPQEEVQALKQIASKLKIPWTKEDRDPYVHNVTCEEFSTITTNATTKTTVWHVVRIFLESNMMQGPLPHSLGSLTNLSRLDMQGTFMEGPFPPELSFLQSLTELRVSDLKNPGGSFPPLEKMLNMQQLDLSFNNFTGEIPENFVNLRSLETIDISYNTFTNLSSAPANCQQESQIASCLRKDLPCDQYRKFYWGKAATIFSRNASTLTMPNAELYTSARLNALSLKYYGLCLQPGNYIVKLHFAEIVFTSGPTFASLGRRVFDVSVQGKKVLRDFNIAEAANGTGKEVIRNFIAPVEGGTLEIHFVWSGKGTNSIPYTGVYGPLISAISVTPSTFHTSSVQGQKVSGWHYYWSCCFNCVIDSGDFLSYMVLPEKRSH
ncbi:unnamed protein product [Spirodela intermedia]|uniref:non-specific serine/threonine protein kinase n=1 Tax=Spirodela intermedia TaxID=51605 RepID=A0A7I8KZM3_SPIIN|nr:unnamed protein product [Spirodela intermedia]